MAAQVLKIYAVVNGAAGILALTLFERMGTLAIVLALASVVASFGIYAAGEALQLLQNISSNTAKAAKRLEQNKI